MELDEFAKLFATFQRTAYRLELLPQYLVGQEAEDLGRFVAGAPLPLDPNSAWCEQVRAATTAGKRHERVRLLPRPITPYVRFEIEWGYVYSAVAGEEISVLDATAVPEGTGSDRVDFWLFDDSIAVSMMYDGDGRFLRPELADASMCLAVMRELEPHVVPLAEYLGQLRRS